MDVRDFVYGNVHKIINGLDGQRGNYINYMNENEKSRLKLNFLSLILLQVLNYGLPLLTLPFLLRALGPSNFGLLTFATATTAYFLIIIDYGFNFSATRQIALSRNSKEKISDIYSSIIIIKIGLILISFIFLNALIFSFDKFENDWSLYYLSFCAVITQSLFPVWLFQGLETMKQITIINTVSKLIFAFCIITFIHNENDYILVPIFNIIGNIFALTYSIFIIKNQLQIVFILPPIKSLMFQIQDGVHIFLSTVASGIYTLSSTFILGIFTNNTTVGYYAAADKLIQAAKGIYYPFSQVIYPYISKRLEEDKAKGLELLKKYTLGISLLMITITLFLYATSDILIEALFGNKYSESVIILKILSPIPLVVALSNIYGILIMLNLGFKHQLLVILLIGACIGLPLNYIMVLTYGGVGTAMATLFTEVFITVALIIWVKWKLNIFNNNLS